MKKSYLKKLVSLLLIIGIVWNNFSIVLSANNNTDVILFDKVNSEENSLNADSSNDNKDISENIVPLNETDNTIENIKNTIEQSETDNEILYSNDSLNPNDINSMNTPIQQLNVDQDSFELNSYNEDFSISVPVNSNTRVKPFIKNEVYYMFIPKSINIENLVIDYTGDITDITGANLDEENKIITGDFQDESEFTITIDNEDAIVVKILQSDVPAVFVNLKNDVTKDVLDGGSKDIKYESTIQLLDDNESNILFDSNAEIKGRGNTSWIVPKKSYQIKFNKKQNPFGIGNSKNKKWVLISNYHDTTLVKNKLMNDLCVNSELCSIPNSNFVDLYINSEYIGNYLLSDKIEINTGRMELDNEDGGIFELDDSFYNEEDYYFRTPITHDYYALKEAVNENVPQNAFNDFKKALISLEKNLFEGKTEWNDIKKLIDYESFVKFYLVNEYSKNKDTYFSSTYFYKNGANDVIHIGPTWDYDKDDFWGDAESDYSLNLNSPNYMRKLYEYPQFASLVNTFYESELKNILSSDIVNEYKEQIQKSARMNNIVWKNEDRFDSRVEQLRDWTDKRIEYFRERYSLDDANVFYSDHIEEKGWDYSRANGETSGTVGKSLRLEGTRIAVTDKTGNNIPVQYQVHVQDYGWMDWKYNGDTAGTVGESRRIEAIKIKLVNNKKYSIKYRTHVQDYGWTDWKYDGEISGTTGESKRVEAIEIQIVDNINIIGFDEINENALITYKGHIQDIGDTGYCSDGEILGTSGRSLRLEGLELSLGESLPNTIGVKVNLHTQDIGWKYGLTDNDYIGTKGQSKRLEAITFKLVGKESEKYSIRYRAHIQDIGWQNWKSDGMIAGTTGMSKRIEAIQIKIEEK